jgi:hypothetical protein
MRLSVPTWQRSVEFWDYRGVAVKNVIKACADRISQTCKTFRVLLKVENCKFDRCFP